VHDPEHHDILPLDPRPLVLVVDDELAARSLLSRMVRILGYQVRSSPGGAPALRFIHQHPGAVHLVLTDLAMPRMDGGELAERVRDRAPEVHVALVAPADDPDADDLLAGYADLPRLTKPVELTDLAELLLALLGPPVSPAFQPPSIRRVMARRRNPDGRRIP
jgi:CheY-like chemotaxis protein